MPPEAIRALLLFVLAIVAAEEDFRRQRIPNSLTLPAIAAGLVLASFSGMGALVSSLGAAAVTLLAGFVLYGLRLLGGGDGKLMAAVAALAGLHFLGRSLLWALLAGGVVSAWLLFRRGALLSLFRDVGGMLVDLVRWRSVDVSRISLEGGTRIPVGVLISLGVIVELVLERAGGSPF